MDSLIQDLKVWLEEMILTYSTVQKGDISSNASVKKASYQEVLDKINSNNLFSDIKDWVEAQRNSIGNVGSGNHSNPTFQAQYEALSEILAQINQLESRVKANPDSIIGGAIPTKVSFINKVFSIPTYQWCLGIIILLGIPAYLHANESDSFFSLYCNAIGATLICSLIVGYFINKQNVNGGFKFMTLFFLVVFSFIPLRNSEHTATSSSGSSSSQNAETYTCPHCNGTGRRYNNITGVYGNCSSCGGSGKVSKWQYDHMTK
jgi:hypothetical protein